MIALVAKRLLWAVFVVWAVTSLAFIVNNVIPGDPARMIVGPQAPAATVKIVREQLGVDRPLATQYARFMERLIHVGPRSIEPAADKDHATCAALVPLYRSGGAWRGLHLDLGRSFTKKASVVSLIAERFPRTLALGLFAILIQIVIGVTAGSLAARKRNTIVDRGTVAMTLLGISAPTFLLGIGIQYLFAFKLRLLPSDGFGTTMTDHARGIVLPALTLGVFGAAYYTRLTRDEMIGILRQDYVRTARAKGVSEWGVVVRHALRNALMPLVTIVGLEAGALVGGAIVTEQIFRWPGLGALSVDALLNRDGPVVIGMVIVTSTAIVLSTLAVDLCYAALDPRMRK